MSIGISLSLSRDDKAQLNRIEAMLKTLTAEGGTMAADLTTIQAEVSRQTTVTQSVLTLIQSLASQLQAAKNDPAAIQAIVDQLKKNDDDLASAVTQNTPAAA